MSLTCVFLSTDAHRQHALPKICPSPAIAYRPTLMASMLSSIDVPHLRLLIDRRSWPACSPQNVPHIGMWLWRDSLCAYALLNMSLICEVFDRDTLSATTHL